MIETGSFKTLGRSVRRMPIWLLFGGAALPANAGTIEKISKGQDKILVSLSPSEMQVLEDGDHVVIEIDKPRMVLEGTLERLNPVKRTVVVVFEDEPSGLERKQTLRFRSPFNNVASSPIMVSLAQYHQYGRSGAEAGLGAFYEGLNTDSEGEQTKSSIVATRLLLSTYLVPRVSWLAGSFSFDRREGKVKSSTGTGAKFVLNQVTPGVQAEPLPAWRVGVAYRYSMLDVRLSGGGAPAYYFELPELLFSAVNFGPDYELGVDYSGGAKNTATDTQANGSSLNSSSSTLKIPSEAFVFYRRVSSPLFIWGVGAGYVFYERSPGNGGPLREKADLPQLLRLRATFEHRLDTGAKFDWGLVYDGAQTTTLSMSAQEANEAGVLLGYQTEVKDLLLVGVEGELHSGSARHKDSEGRGGGSVTGYRASFLAFARYEFDVLKRAPRR